MKRLILVRHAKSSWDNPEHTDFQRPLNARGRRDIVFMADLLKEKISKPDLFLSSGAVRALQTAECFANAFDAEIQKNDSLYDRGTKFIINLLTGLDDKYDSIIIFGHNPDITSLSSYFTGNYFQNVPTCGIVAIEFESNEWEKIEKENGKLLFYEYPKKYSEKV